MSSDQTENSIRIRESQSEKGWLFSYVYLKVKRDEHSFLHVVDRKIQFIFIRKERGRSYETTRIFIFKTNQSQRDRGK